MIFVAPKRLSGAPKIIFGDSLDSVTAEVFLSFVDINLTRDWHYVKDHFNFYDLNWPRIVSNSLYQSKKLDTLREPVTDFGKNLLEICVDIE